MSRWNATYRRRVLAKHYRFAREHLAPYFLDALAAYALELHRLKIPHADQVYAILGELREHLLPSFSGVAEDIFFAIDLRLSEMGGLEVAGSLRRGLSRNDLDITVFRAFARDRALDVLGDLQRLRQRLLAIAEDHSQTLMVAYTHHRPAQPTALGHYLASMENLLSRDHTRIWNAAQSINKSPLGASSLAGNPYPIQRERLAKDLGFEGIIEHTYDAIAAGDWALELAHALSTLATSLSRISRDLLFWAERDGFLVGESIAQGSSIMPQKHNPVIFEHIRILLAELSAGATAFTQLNYSTPWGDANDHSTGVVEPLDQLCEDAEGAMDLLRVALEESRFIPEILASGLSDRTVLASELVDVLVAEGYLPLSEAHHKVKTLLAMLKDEGRHLGELTESDLAVYLGFRDPKLVAALNPMAFLERRNVSGAASPTAQKAHLKLARRRLAQDRKSVADLRSQIREKCEALGKPLLNQ